MDSDGRCRSGANRSASRRSQRSDWLGSNQSPVSKASSANNLSSSEEESELNEGRGFRPPTKSGVVSGRAKVTPSDLVSTEKEYHHAPDALKQHRLDTAATNDIMSSTPQHYYQDIPREDYGHGQNTMNEYESPVLRGHRNLGKRLGPMHGSSMSSSDNNSDTTYAESDINNSLRARMAALDHGTPPDPAPPEVPPRGPSHHHPLLNSQRRGTGGSNGGPGSPHYQDQHLEDGYQQPGANVFLSQGLRSPRFRMKNGQIPERFLGTAADECEYLMSGTSPRYVGTLGTKSPGGHSVFGPSPTRDFIPNDFSQTIRIMNAMGSQKDLGALNSNASGTGAMGSPTRINNLTMGPRPSFSSRKLHLGKTWKERLSWKCVAIIMLLVLCAVLIALLTFFAASYATMDSKGCVVVEDAAKVIAAETQSDTTTSYPTPAFTIPVITSSVNRSPQQMQPNGGTELTRLQVLNRKYSNAIPPQGYWNVQFVVKQPMFIRFSLIVPRSSQLAFYGRRNVAPSITQYDFVEFLRSGRTVRSKRSQWKSSSIEEIDNLEVSQDSHWVQEWLNSLAKDNRRFSDDLFLNSDDTSQRRSKRYLNDREVNVSLVEYLDTGIWYLSVYNDGLATNQVSLLLQEDPELQSACLNDCSGKGSCVLGHCECVQGWASEDCSKSVCPILCSGHGSYGGGICHCDKGWKGQECDVPVGDCELPDCSGHGSCVSGICQCRSGWKGSYCNEVACRDPSCGSNGWCVDGVCICKAGWRGTNCTDVDDKVFTCLPDCSNNGRYDLHSSSCICNDFWSGPDCSIARCNLDCVHGVCDGNICSCETGWTGKRCHEKACDSRCDLHGKCHNGTCLCLQGWNGKHCTIPGCVNRCSGNGICSTEEGEYKCSCSEGWMGPDCSVLLETNCNDEEDNDGDGLVDCNDSECCSQSVCREHVMCMVSSDPVEVLLRKQPPAVTASFYQKVKFIIEDKNVQNFARVEEFTESRVSVIRGQIVTPEGQGIVGVRTSIEKKSKYGLTATRKGGWFDVMVNGGGAVTLQFQRLHFEPTTLTVPVLWNQIVVLDPIVMRLKKQPSEISKEDPADVWSHPCLDHKYDEMKPQIVSTFFPNAIGGKPKSSAIFTENQVVQESLRVPGSDLHLIYQTSSVSGYRSSLLLQLTPDSIPKSLSMVHLKITLEGVVFIKLFEADPNINYTYIWNKRNVYKQKVYGKTIAKVAVGYEYLNCSKIIWESQTSELHGYRMDISDVGGWNLENHHMYNFETGLLQRGDGSTLSLKEAPRLVSVLMGTGTQRTMQCKMCSGNAKEAKLLTPTALASGPDGSIYIGDFNLIRKVSPNGIVTTIFELSSSQVSHGYYITVSPADDHLYISDPEKYRILRLLSMGNVTDPANNYEVVVGTGSRCNPGDEHRCGDTGPALKARLSHPKGIAISSDGTIYVADGTNIRMVDSEGIIHTLIGNHGHNTKWKPLPCNGGIPASQVDLQWPTGLLLSPLDGSLHIMDDHFVLQVTRDGSVRVRVGIPLHCKSKDSDTLKGELNSFAFSPSGSLYVAEQTANKQNFIREITTASKLQKFAGASLEECGCKTFEECSCPKNDILLSSNILFGRISAITVSADGILHAADQNALKIFSFKHFIPEDDQNGDFQIAYPKTNELYLFNRHGHHLETRDMVTGKKIYAFLYSKNTSFGRLSKVTDSSGSKIMFLRDYKASVSQIENTVGEKFKVDISRLGLMTRFSERMDRQYDFAYDDDTGLLLSSSSPGSLTTIYKYDIAGRLTKVISPIGSQIELISSLRNGSIDQKHFSIEINSVSQSGTSHEPYILTMVEDNVASFSQGSVIGQMRVYPNNSWTQDFPFNGKAKTLTTSSGNPILEPYLPVQAQLFPMASQYDFVTHPDTQTNSLFTSFGVVADKRLPQTLVEKVVLVNGSRVLSHKWIGMEKTDKITDGGKNPLLEVVYNDNGQPETLVLGDSFTSINLVYDRFGRVEKRSWNDDVEGYSYNAVGLLASVQSKRSGRTKYHFNEGRQLETIILPSGRTWTYTYDEHGGLKSIATPSGSTHKFSLQPSFGFFIYTYTPPGATQSYRQHLDREGRVILTIFPGSSSRVVTKYSSNGRRESIVSGDGKTSFLYDQTTGLITEIIHEENKLDYKIDYLYNGLLMEEKRTDFSAKTALSNSKFKYEYDSNFRVINLAGRIGGQNLKDFEISYNKETGSVTKKGPFKISRPYYNETVIFDGTAIFSRRTNHHFKVTQMSVTIHKMEVFRMDIKYESNGRISQTDTYTRNFVNKPYTNTKNYTYDADGQLISVEAKEPWNFSYDGFGNMLTLTYSTNTIPMKYDSQDRIVKFGEGGYKHDVRGAIVQNYRDTNYQYNSRGMLTRVSKTGRYNIHYMYDHEGRLIARKDNLGNVTQFMYSNQNYPDQVTHIYNPKDGNLISLVYDDRGHIIFAQMYRNKYYIATDQCGTPVMVFNQYGEVVRDIMRSPYGHIIYDSNPYLYIPIDYCGGILETKTELVHMPGGKIYDPLIGLLMTPSWDEAAKNLLNPSRLSLYRYNGNDPINTEKSHWRNNDYQDWLNLLNFQVNSMAPQLYSSTLSLEPKVTPTDMFTAFTKLKSTSDASPLYNQLKSTKYISGLWENQQEPLRFASRLMTLKPSSLGEQFWPDQNQLEISTKAGPFGPGILVSVAEGNRVSVEATPVANPIFKDVLTSVFNNSQLIDAFLASHNTYVFYFVKPDFWKATEDMTQLNRLAGEVNISFHEPNPSPFVGNKAEKVIDIKLQNTFGTIHIRYGSTLLAESKKLAKHTKKLTIRQAWSNEKDLLSQGLLGAIDWTSNEVDELMSKGEVSGYSVRYVHPSDTYPELMDDPSNVKFYKNTKRTRRTLRSRKSRRCRNKLWRFGC